MQCFVRVVARGKTKKLRTDKKFFIFFSNFLFLRSPKSKKIIVPYFITLKNLSFVRNTISGNSI